MKSNEQFYLAFSLAVQAVSVAAVLLWQSQATALLLLGALVLQALVVAWWKKDRLGALSVTAVMLSSAIWFFSITYSTLPLLPKVAAALGVLVITGFALHKMTGHEAFYGFLMIRSLAGFDLMQTIAKNHPRFVRQAADFGATMTFGIPWSLKTYGVRKATGHALVLIVLLAIMFVSQFLSALGGLWQGSEAYFAVAGLLFGFIGLGVLGMASHAVRVLTVPNTPPGVQLLIPGVTVPWEAVFGIAVIAIVHEMAHGVLCYVEKLKLKSSGVVLFGFLPVGAFVEPDEEKLDGLKLEKKRRILVAGSTSNTLFFVVFFVLALAVGLLLPALVAGVSVSSVPANSTLFGTLSNGSVLVSLDGKPVQDLSSVFRSLNASHNPQAVFEKDGRRIESALMEVLVQNVDEKGASKGILEQGDRILAVEGQTVRLPSDVGKALETKNPGDAVRITTSTGNKTVVLGPEKRLGILAAFAPVAQLENLPKPGFRTVYGGLAFLLIVFSLTYLLSILIAVVNLLPLFITDGQKMLFYELEPSLGKQNAMRASAAAGLVVLGLVLVNALPWFLGK